MTPKLDPVVEANRALLHERSQVGIRKYGVTLGDAKLSERELTVHALEESLDLANYLQAKLQRIDAAPSEGLAESKFPPHELTWLYTHCRAIGMDCKSDSGKWEHDIALFTANQKAKIEELEGLAVRATEQVKPEPSKGLVIPTWRVRERRDGIGGLVDCFVESPIEGDMPYALEVLGDDYAGYGGVERKLEHCKLIVSSVNATIERATASSRGAA